MFSSRSSSAIVVTVSVAIAISVAYFRWQGSGRDKPRVLSTVTTYSSRDAAIGEPFGIAFRDGEVYVSDGAAGTILKLGSDGITSVVANGLNTPSGIAFLPSGDLVVADTGSHTVKKFGAGGVTTLAGVENVSGLADGPVGTATFNGPTGVATTGNGAVYVSDTYNDRIRLIEPHGVVATLAGSSRGFADGVPSKAKFDTPLGIAVWDDKLLVADSGNRRIRVVELHGDVWTLSGTGDDDLRDGTLGTAAFVSPTAITVDPAGAIFIADGNAIRSIGRRALPYVETASGDRRGYADGPACRARFNRPSGIAIGAAGELLIADSDNRVIRALSDGKIGRPSTDDEVAQTRITAEEFRARQPPRWPYDPPDAPREVAGTLGEIRGEVSESQSPVWFHNGLDIAGTYGEVARFIRTETVLDPHAAQNFGTARELLRLPSIGYTHLRLGRDRNDMPISDARFQFERDESGQLANVRVPRGAALRAGEILGTLNSQNHVHLIAGHPGAEINALAALTLPGVSDSIPPVIEKVELRDQSWNEVASASGVRRVSFGDKLRLVVEAYDRMDGNSERRRLGVYRLGYQVLSSATGTAATEADWTIVFDRLPSNAAVRLVYAPGSRSGATGRTSFRFIVTNRVRGDEFSEAFIDSAMLGPGSYLLRAYAADYFGNTTSRDVVFEVVR